MSKKKISNSEDRNKNQNTLAHARGVQHFRTRTTQTYE